MDDLYHQEILEHFKHPHHFGKLAKADLVIEETNASCGDSFTFYVVIDHLSSTISDLQFTGVGCAISTAASSLLIDHLIGQPVSALKTIDQSFMQALIGSKITPTRLKCLMLPAHALKKVTYASR